MHFLKSYTVFAAVLMLSVQLSAQSTPAGSLLSEGRWIKVHTDTTSVYRISRSMLESWGFTNPERVTVAGYGSVERANSLNSAPDDLPVLPVLRTDDALYFFAEGDVRTDIVSSSSAPVVHQNFYSQGSYYFIGERSGVASPDIAMVSPDAPDTPTDVIGTHTSLTTHIYRDSHPTLRGVLSYSAEITASSPLSVDIDITDQAGSGELRYSYVWKHGQSSDTSLSLDFSDGVASHTGSPVKHRLNSNISHRLFNHEENSRVTLTFAEEARRFTATYGNPGGKFSTLALSSYTLTYKRHNRVSESPVILNFTEPLTGETIGLQGVLDGMAAWDVTTPRSPKSIAVHASDDDTSLIRTPADGAVRRLLIFKPTDAIAVPEYAGEAAPQNLQTLPDADMLIVTTDATYDAALRLAAAHEQWQQMKVCVVRQSEVFNEFSSGALHPNSVRQLVCRMASRTARPLRYLLLFGPGSWDTRATFDKSGNEYMVTYGTESYSEMCNETDFYCSDLYFGTLNASIKPSLVATQANMKVSVGRVPAADASAANAYVDKCIAYLSDPVKAGHFNHAIISGGIGNESAHITASENFGNIIRSLSPYATINRAHLSLFTLSNPQRVESQQAYQYMSSRLGGDSRLFSYTGHSSRGLISHTLHTSARELNTRYGSLPVVYMSSCSTTPIDLSEMSLGTTMILHNPGPIAVIGAGGEVFLNLNITLNNRFIELFYSPEGGECLGDVFRLAVNSTPTSNSQMTNNLCYNFLGDPALPRYYPDGVANVTAIGETAINGSNSRIGIPAMKRTRLAGNVTGSDGKTDTSFSGKLYINIYNTPHNLNTLRHDNSDKVHTLSIDDEVLYSTVADVVNGEWSTDITLPAVNRTGTNRMTLNAVSADRLTASGGNSLVTITPVAVGDGGSDADVTPPAIRLWLDTPDMTDGAIVTSSPVLNIEITDSGSGTNLNAASIGMMPRVAIDGSNIAVAAGLIQAVGNGTASGSYKFDNLSDGPHTITVSARDVAGNTGTADISFTVVTADPTAAIEVSSDIVRDEVTFSLSHSLPYNGACCERLVIRDMEGHTVLSRSTAFPYTWDLNGTDGAAVPDGTYRASVIIDSKPYYTATPEVEFTIVKPITQQ